jgi:DNA polymerase III epsilon subunit family exonuclease
LRKSERGRLKYMARQCAPDPEKILSQKLRLFNARGKVARKIANSWQTLNLSNTASLEELNTLNLSRLRFWVVDVETTGCRADEDRLIELAAVEISDLKLGLHFSSLVRPGPGIELPRFITNLTGITDQMLAQAPRPEEVMPLFFRLVKTGIFVAHPASFDWKFIQKESDQPLNMPKVCNLRLARRIHHDLKNHKLDTLADHYRFRFPDDHSAKARHRALGDALVTARIFIRFIKQLNMRGIKQFQDLKRFEKIPLKKAREFMAG